MKISAETKISELIKANASAIDAIASINKHFEKLRNPILRKILAPRVTIADAAKIGHSSVEIFFTELSKIGFEIDVKHQAALPTQHPLNKPEFVSNINSSTTTTLDVRDDLKAGKDPFQKIMAAVDSLTPGHTLLLINTFEPIPLIKILSKKGYLYHTETNEEGLVHVFFQKNKENKSLIENLDKAPSIITENEFDELLERFNGRTIEIDVRELEMPQPMIKILQSLETMESNTALFVHHKKLPIYLLPELEERNFKYVYKNIEDGNVKLLIFK